MTWRRLAAGVALAAGAACAGAALGAADPLHRVEIKDVGFAPPVIRVRVGEAVEWTNNDPVAHTATASDGSWEVDLQPGESGRREMQKAGTFGYLCRYHPNMTGTIVVAP
ncbi:hypothetical protein SLNSH_23840 [Alsobacter soli]|uniref:EfeO-type cupredoxin-like domain-containing protein n=1 Tax=Alsobacter soli TaxID=2109933 RepID=A0A2T1HLF5_9HYPH|nr:cupredoxin domain-containing protein [Alsobacter soli]PSC02474.1 hypothetical protein SLNSH_23840 [Alsobacter soli]